MNTRCDQHDAYRNYTGTALSLHCSITLPRILPSTDESFQRARIVIEALFAQANGATIDDPSRDRTSFSKIVFVEINRSNGKRYFFFFKSFECARTLKANVSLVINRSKGKRFRKTV